MPYRRIIYIQNYTFITYIFFNYILLISVTRYTVKEVLLVCCYFFTKHANVFKELCIGNFNAATEIDKCDGNLLIIVMKCI